MIRVLAYLYATAPCKHVGGMEREMDKCPKIGDRVRYAGAGHVGPCTGTVLRIYENDVWDDDNIDWDDDDVIPWVTVFPIGRAPESEWQVALKCDNRPTPWCYGDDLVFAPSVSDLSPIGQRTCEQPGGTPRHRAARNGG